MPTLPRDERVEFPARGLSVFEGRHFDLHTAVPRELGQPCIRVDPEHLAPGRLKLPRHDAGANAHVENAPSRDRSNDALSQDIGIARPGPVITLGIRPERFCRLTLVMRPVLGARRSLGCWHANHCGYSTSEGHVLTQNTPSLNKAQARGEDVTKRSGRVSPASAATRHRRATATSLTSRGKWALASC